MNKKDGNLKKNEYNISNKQILFGFVIVILILFINYIIIMNIIKIETAKYYKEIEIQYNHRFDKTEDLLQDLSAGITFNQKRKRLLLTIRDIIIEESYPKLKPVEAYRIAEIILDTSEQFKNIDPVLILSIQRVESQFNPRSLSPAGAVGINQIIPSTGRLLCRTINWEYSRDILFDPKKSTYLMAIYVDILFTQYNDKELVLAGYNGGPRNSYYYKTGNNKLSLETKQYVKKVLTTYNNYQLRIRKGSDV